LWREQSARWVETPLGSPGWRRPPMRNVELRTRICRGYVVVALRGELDTTDAEAVAGAVVALTADRQQLIIDLETLDFIDCHAMGALLRARATAQRAGGDVLLAAPHGPVPRLLTLLDVPDVYASVAAAVDRAGSDGRHRAAGIAWFRRAALSGARYWLARSAFVPEPRDGRPAPLQLTARVAMDRRGASGSTAVTFARRGGESSGIIANPTRRPDRGELSG